MWSDWLERGPRASREIRLEEDEREKTALRIQEEKSREKVDERSPAQQYVSERRLLQKELAEKAVLLAAREKQEAAEREAVRKTRETVRKSMSEAELAAQDDDENRDLNIQSLGRASAHEVTVDLFNVRLYISVFKCPDVIPIR